MSSSEKLEAFRQTALRYGFVCVFLDKFDELYLFDSKPSSKWIDRLIEDRVYPYTVSLADIEAMAPTDMEEHLMAVFLTTID